MRYPAFLKENDVAGVTAPSFGIRESDLGRYFAAKEFFASHGINIVETADVFTSHICASAPKEERARQFVGLYEDEDISGIFAASGGELELLIADSLYWERIKDKKPKFFCGYSDNTVITYTLATRFDTASVYGSCFCKLGEDTLSAADHISLLTGRKLKFRSYPKHCENYSFEMSEEEAAEFNAVTEWKSLAGGGSLSGRLLGGCLDILGGICGTRADATARFNAKYGKEGILWFLESCDLNPAGVARTLWQLKSAGWFDCASGFIFGRPYVSGEMFGLTFEGAVTEILGDTGLPVVVGADIGHVPPVIPVFSGAYSRIEVEGGKAEIEYMLV